MPLFMKQWKPLVGGPSQARLLLCDMSVCACRCCSSALNGEELVRDGGISLLATLLARCMSVVQRTTPSTDPAAVIVSNIMRTFAGTFFLSHVQCYCYVYLTI